MEQLIVDILTEKKSFKRKDFAAMNTVAQYTFMTSLLKVLEKRKYDEKEASQLARLLALDKEKSGLGSVFSEDQSIAEGIPTAMICGVFALGNEGILDHDWITFIVKHADASLIRSRAISGYAMLVEFFVDDLKDSKQQKVMRKVTKMILENMSVEELEKCLEKKRA